MHAFFSEIEEDHPLSRIDPRVKLLSALALLVMVLTSKAPLFPLLVTVLSLALCLFLGLSAKRLLLRFSEPLFIVAVLIVIKCFFTGQQSMGSLHFFGLEITGHRDGLIDGLLIACRIIGGVSLVAALSASTRFTDLLGALAWLRVPKNFIEYLGLCIPLYFPASRRCGGHLRGPEEPARLFERQAGFQLLRGPRRLAHPQGLRQQPACVSGHDPARL